MTPEERQYFIDTAETILCCDMVQEMKKYPQHGKTNALCHMVSVAWEAYQIALKLNHRFSFRMDFESLIRGALLHDLFLYDWHDPNNGHKLHGFTHPYSALKNAQKIFFLNEKEKNIIVRHMFPFTPIPPKYRESLIVSIADKICSSRETINRDKQCTACHVCPLSRTHLLEKEENR